jgi:hypothetical protein
MIKLVWLAAGVLLRELAHRLQILPANEKLEREADEIAQTLLTNRMQRKLYRTIKQRRSAGNNLPCYYTVSYYVFYAGCAVDKAAGNNIIYIKSYWKLECKCGKLSIKSSPNCEGDNIYTIVNKNQIFCIAFSNSRLVFSQKLVCICIIELPTNKERDTERDSSVRLFFGLIKPI